MKALVTGACGFIGCHLCGRLAEEGIEVIALARPGEKIPERIKNQCLVKTGDIMDVERIESLLKDIDLVFHLAARTDLDGRDIADYEVNTRGTEIVLKAAEKNRAKRFVLYSSMLAVALTGSTAPIDESFTAANHTSYGKSKREAERIVSCSKIPWTIIRPTLVYGPGEKSTMCALFKAIGSRRFMLIGREVIQSFVYVKNLVDATVKASLNEAGINQIFFVNDNTPYTLRQFSGQVARELNVSLIPFALPYWLAWSIGLTFECLSKVTGITLPLCRRRVGTMTTHYVYSISKIRELVGWNPPFGLEDGVRETVQYYRENGDL